MGKWMKLGAIAAFCTLVGLAANAANASGGAHVLFIFDASGSMKKEVNGRQRITVAKEAFGNTVLAMPQSASAGLMIYGARRAKDCTDIELVSPIGSVEPGQLLFSVAGLQAKGETPIAEAILQGARSFEKFQGDRNSIVLLTDGIEECNGDPCAAAQAVKDMGLDLKINIVGFTLNSRQRETIECMATATGGLYYDAADAGALLGALTEVTEAAVVAQQEAPPPEPPPAPPPPVEKARKVVFSDEFDGSDLSPENWEVLNANTDGYIVEKGNLMTISAAAGGFANPDLANVFKLKQALPDGDYTVTVKFKLEFHTGTESVSVGLFQDPKNYIAASLNAHYKRYESDWVEADITKVSKGEATGFKAKFMETSGTGYDDAAAYVADLNKIEQPITLKLTKEAREYRASVNFAGQKDDKGEPVWLTTEPVSSLRPPGELVLTTSQTEAESGESAFFVDSITIDVPGD